MTEEFEDRSQERPKMDHRALMVDVAKRRRQKSDRLKVEKLAWKFGLVVCVIIALTPPFLYHRGIIDLYSLAFIKDEVVIGYITGFYVSSLLACRVSKDYSLEEIDKLRTYKEDIHNPETWGVKETDATSELSATMNYASQGYDCDIESNRIIIYAGRCWVVITTYLYISFFHAHIFRYISMLT